MDDDNARLGRWLWTCGCGREIWILHARVFVKNEAGQPCERPDHRVAFDDRPIDGLVASEIGWCGCGNPEDVDEWMLAYLRSLVDRDFPKPVAVGLTEQAEVLLAYAAASLDWTEHGGSIGGAWLTDEGRAAMDRLTAAVGAR